MTYGTTTGSFLATRCLQQLTVDEGHDFPSENLKRDFYVDLLTGADSCEGALQHRNEMIGLLSRGGFHLRQWASNNGRLVDHLDERSNIEHLCLDKDSVKTLGIRWRYKDDAIVYAMNAYVGKNERLTKRVLLSQIATIFDPLRLLGPVIVKAKILIQQFWELKLEWDETVPMDIITMWNEYKTQLHKVGSISVPRGIIIGECCDLQLHGFCDASEKAFGTYIYLRSTNRSGDCIVRLVCAKSRVAPIKKITLSRLELCAAVLLARLYAVTSAALKREFSRIYFWSDSTIAIHWIYSSPHKLKTFVANRVAQIQNATKQAAWRHVPSEHILRMQYLVDRCRRC